MAIRDRKASYEMRNDVQRLDNIENSMEHYNRVPSEFDGSYIDCDWLCPDCAEMVKREWKWFYS